MNNILHLNKLNKHYTQGNNVVEILKDITLKIPAGKMIAIIGASGSGKSTLLHVAGLLDKPTSGEVIYIDEVRPSPDQIRLKKIGFIYQYHHLIKDFNARENVALPALINKVEWGKALDQADALLNKLSLANKKLNTPGELSGGEQQRVAIARSLINNPSIILADEPTGNLDPKTAEEVFNFFIKIVKDTNTSVIMVTHNHELANRMDEVYELKNGGLTKLARNINKV